MTTITLPQTHDDQSEKKTLLLVGNDEDAADSSEKDWFPTACELVRTILKDVSPCHGYDHAMAVVGHVDKALASMKTVPSTLTATMRHAVRLAALLHDVDDPKLFPKHAADENAKAVLAQVGVDADTQQTILDMVHWVSSSKWGDTIPGPVLVNRSELEWMLYPRYADRIEALGKVGIERANTYRINVQKGGPIRVATTPIVRTEQELWSHATEARYKAYSGKSASMMDHYYDKLLRLSSFPVSNPYLNEQARLNQRLLIDFVLYESRFAPHTTNADILAFLDPSITSKCTTTSIVACAIDSTTSIVACAIDSTTSTMTSTESGNKKQ